MTIRTKAQDLQGGGLLPIPGANEVFQARIQEGQGVGSTPAPEGYGFQTTVGFRDLKNVELDGPQGPPALLS